MGEWAGPISAFCSSVTWAIGTSGYSRLAKTYTPTRINFSRAAVGLPFFAVLAFVLAGGWNGGMQEFGKLTAAHWGWFALSMFSSYGIGDVLFFLSTRSLGVPGALAIASSYPLWTSLGGFWLRHEGVSTLQFVGLSITLSGIIVVILHGPKAEAKPVDHVAHRLDRKGVGIALAFATSLFWGLNTLAVSQGGTGVNAGVANTSRMVLALIICFIVGRLGGDRTPPLLPAAEFKRSAWIFFAESVFGSFFFMFGLAHSPLVLGSTLVALSPVLAVPAAWMLGGERPNLWRTTGVVLTVVGVWLLVSQR